MAVEVIAGAVVATGRAGIGVTGEVLHVAERERPALRAPVMALWRRLCGLKQSAAGTPGLADESRDEAP